MHERPFHPSLSSRDIIAYEQTVRDMLANFVPFREYRLHFPPRERTARPEWLPRERRLLIPLRGTSGENGEGLLAVFAARPLSARTARQALPFLEQIADLCVRHIRLLKAASLDADTGLFRRERLVGALCAEIDALRDPQSTASSGFGLIALDCSRLRTVAQAHGHGFAGRLLRLIADAVREESAERAIAARIDEYAFAVLAPGVSAASGSACLHLAQALATRANEITIPCAVTGEAVGALPGCGLAMFPADADVGPGAFGAPEQALRLLARARAAAALSQKQGTVMPFSRILLEGGQIVELRPFSRLTTSLGTLVRAAEGQRFSVHHAGRYKGDLVLSSVGTHTSEAELLRLEDPADPVRPGDQLRLLTERAGKYLADASGSEKEDIDPVSGFLRHRAFLARFNTVARRSPAFCLALLRVNTPTDGAIRTVALRVRAEFGEDADGLLPVADSGGCGGQGPPVGFRDYAGGRYGLNSLICWHPGVDPEALRTRYERLAACLLEKDGLETGIGIARHPFLDFHKADALENCVSALDYALLLPPPHVGLLDSLGLTVRADKLLNQGDAFGAVTTYQRALLADPANHTAHNSLGVCLAGLGRHAEAERHFLEALRARPESVNTQYNLGTVYQAMNDTARARARFRACLKISPDHLYACLRLGQLAEAENSLKRARHWYARAERLPGGLALTRRPLAALALKQGKNADARRLLYDALSHNPMDAVALGLLAQLYMDEGEAPALAEALARQSIALRPENGRNWTTLADALAALGKTEEAHAARARG